MIWASSISRVWLPLESNTYNKPDRCRSKLPTQIWQAPFDHTELGLLVSIFSEQKRQERQNIGKVTEEGSVYDRSAILPFSAVPISSW